MEEVLKECGILGKTSRTLGRQPTPKLVLTETLMFRRSVDDREHGAIAA